MVTPALDGGELGIVWALGFLSVSVGFALASAAGAGPWLLRGVKRQQVVAVVAVGAGALAAAFSPAGATGSPLIDAFYRAVVVGAVTYLGSRLRLPVLAGVAVVSGILSGGHGAALLGVLAAAGALVGWRDLGRSSGSGRAAGPAAVTAGCCALSVLQPGAVLPTGVSAIGSALVLTTVALLGYLKSPKLVRRRVRLVVLGSAALLGIAGTLGVVALAEARPALEVGVRTATRGADEARRLESESAARSMRSAAEAFQRANSRVRSPQGRAGTVVPLFSQQLRAVRVASGSGAELGLAGASLAEAVDQQALRIVDGRIPLERLVEAQPKAARAAAAIAKARASIGAQRSPWLLPQLTSRLDRVQRQLATAGDQADRASALLTEIPPLLGANGPKRYFVAVQTPSELRGSGGFMGSFAEIAVDNGRLSLARTGRTAELNQGGTTKGRTLDAPDDFLKRYAGFDVATTWQNVTVSPHFPSDAQVIRSLYPQSGGRPIDAVIAIDPFAIQAILGVVGPIQVPGAAVPLTGENAAEVLLFDQYRDFADNEQGERVDFLADATRALAERLLGGAVPIRPLATALQPMVAEKHLMVSAGAAAEQPAFARLGLTGAIAPLRGDFLAVVVQNAGANKIDWFLRRKIDYQATVDPDSGALSAKATIQLTNQAPASGLPLYLIGNTVGEPKGTSRMYVSVYSPLLLARASLEGQPLILQSQTEQDRGVYSAFINVPAGATRTLTIDLEGAVQTGEPYRLDLHRQASTVADQVSVSLTVAQSPQPPIRREIRLTRDTVLEVPLTIG